MVLLAADNTLLTACLLLLQNASADSPAKFDYEALEAAAIAFDPTAVVAQAP